MEKHCVARPLKRVPAIFLLVPLESKRRCRARARARGRRIATRCTTVNHHHPTPVARRHRKGCGRVCELCGPLVRARQPMTFPSKFLVVFLSFFFHLSSLVALFSPLLQGQQRRRPCRVSRPCLSVISFYSLLMVPFSDDNGFVLLLLQSDRRSVVFRTLTLGIMSSSQARGSSVLQHRSPFVRACLLS